MSSTETEQNSTAKSEATKANTQKAVGARATAIKRLIAAHEGQFGQYLKEARMAAGLEADPVAAKVNRQLKAAEARVAKLRAQMAGEQPSTLRPNATE